MTLGEKVKKIRTFRGMTQRELGIQLGYEKNSADVRIAQYEAGSRKPKKETLAVMAEILGVSPENFISADSGSEEDIIQMLLWLDESDRNYIQLFSMEKVGSAAKADVPCVTDDISENAVGIYLENDSINRLLREWLDKKRVLKEGELTEQEYMEWKLNVR